MYLYPYKTIKLQPEIFIDLSDYFHPPSKTKVEIEMLLFELFTTKVKTFLNVTRDTRYDLFLKNNVQVNSIKKF